MKKWLIAGTLVLGFSVGGILLTGPKAPAKHLNSTKLSNETKIMNQFTKDNHQEESTLPVDSPATDPSSGSSQDTSSDEPTPPVDSPAAITKIPLGAPSSSTNKNPGTTTYSDTTSITIR